MRKFLLMTAVFACCFLLAACGYGADKKTEVKEENKVDILSSSAQLIEAEEEEKGDCRYLGMQFYQGKPVQIWAEEMKKESNQMTASLYLHTSQGKELLYPELKEERDFFPQSGILDEDGNFYGIVGEQLTKYNPKGEKLYSVSIGGLVWDVCVLSEEQLALQARKMGETLWEIVLLDTASGECTEFDLQESLQHVIFLGSDKNRLLGLDKEGLWEIDIKEGEGQKIVPFAQTSYAFTASAFFTDRKMEAFRVTEDGKIELLWVDAQGNGSLESLEQTDINEDKKAIVLRGIKFYDSWLKEQVAEFNRISDKYYVAVEECEDLAYVDNYITRTGVELATGKGPDILYKTDILGQDMDSLIQKGLLLDLKPCLEQSGLREEDYFPAAFDGLRSGEEIYGVNIKLAVSGYAIKRSVLENGGTAEEAIDEKAIDAETILDALLAYDEKAVYRKGCEPEEMVQEFLEGSESLWGMVDRTEKSCSFSGPLFAKLLEAAKRYGYDERNDYEALSERRNCDRLYFFEDETQLADRGLVPFGVLFDDGSHGKVETTFLMMINANSSNREGALEFLKFLLSEEVQTTIEASQSLFPASRRAFSQLAEREIETGAVEITYLPNGGVHTRTKGAEDLTVEKAAEIEAYLENARPLPIQNQPILDIICEEAQDYFDDLKSIEEVVKVIENRVQLYLKEKN